MTTRCYSCSTSLTPVLPGDTNDAISGTTQLSDALWVSFYGGFGMFLESRGYNGVESETNNFGSDAEVVLCHDCVHDACDALPWMKRLLENSGHDCSHD